MTQRPAGNGEQAETVNRQRSVTEAIMNECLPSEKNVEGIERAGRAIVGLLMGGFVIIGAVAATRPAIGLGALIVLSVVSLSLLATAKIQKCPVKHVTTRP